MATKLLKDVCKDIKHIFVEGHGHWSDGTIGTHMPIRRNANAGQQGHYAPEHL